MTPSKPDAARDPVAALLAAALYREHDYTVDKGAARSALNRLAEQGYVLVGQKELEAALDLMGLGMTMGERQRFAETILAAIQEQAGGER